MPKGDPMFQTNPCRVEAIGTRDRKTATTGFRRTLVGLKLEFPAVRSLGLASFRRTFVGLKHVVVVHGPRHGQLQTNSCKVEAGRFSTRERTQTGSDDLFAEQSPFFFGYSCRELRSQLSELLATPLPG